MEARERVIELFTHTFDVTPALVCASPGRVNLIGEHIDYNDGICLPIALDMKTYIAFRARSDDEIHLVSDGYGQWHGSLSEIYPGADLGWVAYAAGIARTLDVQTGFSAAYVSEVPSGAGLSSSAAIECATGLALVGASDRLRIVQAAIAAENDIAGAPTGGMDQFASLLCEEGHALFLDTTDWSYTHIPFDLDAEGLALLVVDSRATHALVDGQYAERRESCREALRLLMCSSWRDVTVSDLSQLEGVLQKRARHVVTEIARTFQVRELLEERRISDIGPLLTASHASLRDDYEVSCPELDLIVSTALSSGALGARMTGGGFGGSALVLCQERDTDVIRESLLLAFSDAGYATPQVWSVKAGQHGDRIDI